VRSASAILHLTALSDCCLSVNLPPSDLGQIDLCCNPFDANQAHRKAGMRRANPFQSLSTTKLKSKGSRLLTIVIAFLVRPPTLGLSRISSAESDMEAFSPSFRLVSESSSAPVSACLDRPLHLQRSFNGQHCHPPFRSAGIPAGKGQNTTTVLEHGSSMEGIQAAFVFLRLCPPWGMGHVPEDPTTPKREHLSSTS